jgi:hypothetical protein
MLKQHKQIRGSNRKTHLSRCWETARPAARFPAAAVSRELDELGVCNFSTPASWRPSPSQPQHA